MILCFATFFASVMHVRSAAMRQSNELVAIASVIGDRINDTRDDDSVHFVGGHHLRKKNTCNKEADVDCGIKSDEPEVDVQFFRKEDVFLCLFVFVTCCLFMLLFLILKKNKGILQRLKQIERSVGTDENSDLHSFLQKTEQLTHALNRQPYLSWSLSENDYHDLKNEISIIGERVNFLSKHLVGKTETPDEYRHERRDQNRDIYAPPTPEQVFNKRTITCDAITSHDPLGFFIERVKENYTDGIFVITQIAERKAELSINTNVRSQERVFGSLSEMIGMACEEFEPVQSASRIINVETGVLERENGMWVIRKKMRIQLVKN